MKTGSLQRISIKRLFVIFIALPLIILHVLFSHLCLLLDHLFFPSFKKALIIKPVFIVGFPRSGTSFLLNLLANNEESFTAFRLWEMVFAPSVLQKIFFLRLGAFLSIFISPLKLSQKMDRLLFYKMKDVHEIEFADFEEDEMLFVYNFQSAYFAFIFPELEYVHGLLTPDNPSNIKKRIAGQQLYKSLIKRHMYVFNQDESKTFLSKNPFHPLRMESLTTVFPNGKYLFNQRPLEKIIPSTLSLNITLYNYFCRLQKVNPLRKESIANLLEWHIALFELKKNQDWEELSIDFKNMVTKPSNEAKRIQEWLSIPLNENYQKYLDERDLFSQNYQSPHSYDALSEEEILMIEEAMDKCQN